MSIGIHMRLWAYSSWYGFTWALVYYYYEVVHVDIRFHLVSWGMKSFDQSLVYLLCHALEYITCLPTYAILPCVSYLYACCCYFLCLLVVSFVAVELLFSFDSPDLLYIALLQFLCNLLIQGEKFLLFSLENSSFLSLEWRGLHSMFLHVPCLSYLI